MWQEVEVHVLPMGDKYIIERCDKTWRGIVQRKDDRTRRIQCSETYSIYTVKEYMSIARAAQEDCLNGFNPYITQEAAKAYAKSKSYAAVS